MTSNNLIFYTEWSFPIVSLNEKDRCQCIPRKGQKPIPSRYTTADYKKSKENLKKNFQNAYKGEIFTGEVYLVFVTNYTKHDSDAHLKIVFDALEGIVLKNDFQISDHRVKRRTQNHCSVTIYAKENLLPIFGNNDSESKNPFDEEEID